EKRQVALFEPLRRFAMKLSPMRFQDRFVYGVPEQGMRELQPRAVRAHEAALDEQCCVVIRLADRVPERVEPELLTEHSSGLQRAMIEVGEVIRACQNERAHRARQRLAAGICGAQ